MDKLDTWLASLEEIVDANLLPFKPHIIQECFSEHEKNAYVKLHVAIILFNGRITADQERLYQFYLPSISTEIKLSEGIRQAEAMDSNELKHCIEIVRDKNVEYHFLLDILVFLRLGGELKENARKILNRYCAATQIDNQQAEQVIFISDCIAGVNDSVVPVDKDILLSLLNNQMWLEFIAEKLTTDTISQVNGGTWLVDESTPIFDANIHWKNCLIIFSDNGSLNVVEGDLKIEKSTLFKPRISCKKVNITMEAIHVQGEYRKEKLQTAFSFTGSPNVVVNNSFFATHNARAFWFRDTDTPATFKECEFRQCGNPDLLGGAVFHKQGIKFIQCHFFDGIADVAGAIFGECIKPASISQCRFVNNQSVSYWSPDSDKPLNAGCVYYERDYRTTDESGEHKSKIIECFIDNSISLYKLSECSSYSTLLGESIIEREIIYRETSDNNNYGICDESIKAMGLNTYYAKNLSDNSVAKFCDLVSREEKRIENIGEEKNV
jgi:hypothetical protein